MATIQAPAVNGHHLEPHSPSIQDVIDESDLRHPEQPRSTSVLEDKDAIDTPSWVPPTSGGATTQQKSAAAAPTTKETANLDTQSHELFPELGAPKGKQTANVVPNWGSKRSSAVSTPPNTNGATSNGVSAPVHTSSTSSQPPRFGPQSLPGQHQERISLQPSQMMPRAQMRRPLQDVLKDINKRSKANVAMSTGQGGLIWLTATGPEAACRQALHEVVAQVGSKVGGDSSFSHALPLTMYSNRSKSSFPLQHELTSSAKLAPRSRRSRRRREHVSRYRSTATRSPPPTKTTMS